MSRQSSQAQRGEEVSRYGGYGGYGNQCGPYPPFYPPFPFPGGDKEIPIHCVPFVIDCPGKYKVVKDLCYSGDKVAIVIRASNVDLNFHTHNLILKNDNATGVLVADVEEVVIRHDKIILELPQGKPRCLSCKPHKPCDPCKPCPPPPEEPGQCAAIHVRNSNKVDILDCFVENTGFGILAENTTDLRILRLLAKNNYKSNLLSSGTCGTRLEDSKATNVVVPGIAGIATFPSETAPTRLLTIRNTNLYNSDLFLLNLDGGLIDQVDSLIDDDSYRFNALQTGSSITPGAKAENVTVTHSNFKVVKSENQAPGTQAGGIGIAKGSRNVVIDSTSSKVESQTPENNVSTSALLLGGAGNVVKNCSLQAKGQASGSEDALAVVVSLSDFPDAEGNTPESFDNFLEGNQIVGENLDFGVSATISSGASWKENTLKIRDTPIGVSFVNTQRSNLLGGLIDGAPVGIEYDEQSSENNTSGLTIRFSTAPVRDFGSRNTNNGPLYEVPITGGLLANPQRVASKSQPRKGVKINSR